MKHGNNRCGNPCRTGECHSTPGHRAQHPIGKDVRVWVAALTRNGVHASTYSEPRSYSTLLTKPDRFVFFHSGFIARYNSSYAASTWAAAMLGA